jgi:ABC-type lipoprotein release transport system permease subunit
MQRFLAIAGTGVTSVLQYPLRSVVTISALVAVLVPYLVGLGISCGMRDNADQALRHGADLYVTAEQFGRPGPLPSAVADEIKAMPGVRDASPRIVGRIELGKDRIHAVVVGVSLARLPPEVECIEGRLYQGGSRDELVVGSELASRLNLKVGSLLPPFYHSRSGDRVAEVVGIFRSDISPWQSRLIVTSFETAARMFDQPSLATDVMVFVLPGYEEEVRTAILRDGSHAFAKFDARPRVTARADAAALLAEGPARREGVLTLLSIVAFAVAILVVLVTSGFGSAERRREVGILKATGWQTDELLVRSLVESLVIAFAAASVAVLLAVVWLVAFNGYAIAGVFLPGVERTPGFRVPFRLMPAPALLTLLVSIVVVASGSLNATWRTAMASPREMMR